jgi:hypothetical protein
MVITPSTHPTPRASRPTLLILLLPLLLLLCLLLLDLIHNIIRYAKIFDLSTVSISESISQVQNRPQTHVISPNITLGHPEEFIPVRGCLYDFFEREVHVGVAGDQVAIEGFAVFELD